jgi:hypothetical protein
MAIRSSTWRSDQTQGIAIKAPAARPPALLLFALLFSFCLALILMLVLALSRLALVPQPLELPPRYLPGSPYPSDTACYTPAGESMPRCSVDLLGNDVYFNFDNEKTSILRSIIPTQEYRIGDLVLAWGSPSGIKQQDTLSYVYWGRRSALLYTRSLQPHSRVTFILFDPVETEASPWRGFGRWRG